MPYRLTCSLWLPLDRSACFGFFEDAQNLPRITPPWLGFKIVTPQIELRPGCLIDYTVKFGVQMKWRTLIEEYQPPVRFVDRQLRGPYRLWHHLHTFEEVDGGTLMKDAVTYLPPFGVVGRMSNSLIVQPRLREIFEFRQRTIAAILLGEGASEAQRREPVRFSWISNEESGVSLAPPAF